ncbi:MAG: hypothetical protein OXI83_19505, partial [Gemmatimonadota bacterium]|nr:hypothetical protein [Gemmatimonadota bacterium]
MPAGGPARGAVTPLRLAAVLALAAVAAAPFARPAAAQEQEREAREWVLPRTAFGHPDLQG